MKEGWKVKRLGDVCDTGAGGTPLKQHEEYYTNGSIPWLRSGEVCKKEIYETELFITELGLNNSSARLFPINTVLIAMYGATAGQVGILKIESATNQAVCGILPNEDFIPEFLYYFFLFYKEKLVAQARGGAQPNISQIKIKNTNIPCISISEQQRIIEILDNAFAKIDTVKQNAERNRDNAKELFQNSADLILNLKPHWRLLKLSEICTLITDGTHSTPKYINKGVPFLSVKNLTKGFLDFSDTRFISEEEHSFLTKRCKPEKEDILYTKVGTTGIAQVIDTDREFSIFVSVALLKIKHDIIYNYYLQHALNAPQAREQAKKRTRGTANKNLVITDIKEITVPVPSSLEEQQQIVSKLDALSAKCKELEKNYQQTIHDCDELKKAILAKAFNGEL